MSDPITLVGIDPGSRGGIAWKHPGEIAVCAGMPPTEGDLIFSINNLSKYNSVFYLEDLVKHTGPKLPASAMAVYASNWGVIKGAILMAGRPLHLVHPKCWQKILGLGSRKQGQTKTQWKNKLKSEAQRLYPHLEVTLQTADALLILEYARLHQGGWTGEPIK